MTISGNISSNDFCSSSFTSKSPSTGIIYNRTKSKQSAEFDSNAQLWLHIDYLLYVHISNTMHIYLYCMTCLNVMVWRYMYIMHALVYNKIFTLRATEFFPLLVRNTSPYTPSPTFLHCFIILKKRTLPRSKIFKKEPNYLWSDSLPHRTLLIKKRENIFSLFNILIRLCL